MKRREHREYFLPMNRNNNRFLDLEDKEDENNEIFEDEKETYKSTDEESQGYNNKDATTFEVEKLSAEDMENILTRYNELHPD